MTRHITPTIISLLLAVQALPAHAHEPSMPGIDQALRLRPESSREGAPGGLERASGFPFPL